MLSMNWGLHHESELSHPVTANNKGKFQALFELYKSAYADTPAFWTSTHYRLGLHARKYPRWKSVADGVFEEGFKHFSRNGIKGDRLSEFSFSSAFHCLLLKDYDRAEEQIEIAIKILSQQDRNRVLYFYDLFSHLKRAADIYYHIGAYGKARKTCEEMFENAENLKSSDKMNFRFDDHLKYEGMLHRLDKLQAPKEEYSKMEALFSNVQRG